MKKIFFLAVTLIISLSVFSQQNTSGRLLKVDTSAYRPLVGYRQFVIGADNNPYYWNGTKFVSVSSGSITALGTVTSGVWHGTVIGAQYGGTGYTGYTIGDMLQASSSTALSRIAAPATGNVLISGGVATVSSWGKVGLATHVSGNLPVANLNSGTSADATTFWGGDATWKNPFANPVLPALQYNSTTTTTNVWTLATGERFLTLRDDSSYHATGINGPISGLSLFIGRNAGNTTTVGSNCIGIGDSALASVTGTGGTAYRNIAIGMKALSFTTTGTDVVAVGARALRYNTTGAGNTAIGSLALEFNTTASFNTAVGTSALAVNTTGSSNTVVGYQAASSMTTGSDNNAFGISALRSCVLGWGNSAFGYGALRTTNGYGNTAMGDSSLRSNAGDYNTAIGYRAGYLATGSSGVYIGKGAGENATAGGELYISNIAQSSLANDKLYSLFYGVFPSGAGSVSGSSLTINAAKRNITSGANTSMGTATLSSGTITVSNTTVTASSLIKVWLLTPGGTIGIQYAAPPASIVASTSFVINAYQANGTVLATDTSVVGWEIIN